MTSFPNILPPPALLSSLQTLFRLTMLHCFLFVLSLALFVVLSMLISLVHASSHPSTALKLQADYLDESDMETLDTLWSSELDLLAIDESEVRTPFPSCTASLHMLTLLLVSSEGAKLLAPP